MLYTLATLLASLIRLIRFVLPTKGTLIVTPAGPGSLGDEAMFEGLAGRLGERGEGPVYLLARAGELEWVKLNGIDHYVVPAGGNAMRTLQMVGQFLLRKRLFIVGADCIDGYYSIPNTVRLIRIADLAARCGLESTIVGSSYKEDAAPEADAALRQMSSGVHFCSRDEVSLGRIKKASGKDPHLVADAAFMLIPDPDGIPSEVSRWVDEQKAAGRAVLVVNFNRQVIDKDEEKREELFQSYLTALERVQSERPVSFLFVPHDYRNELSDAHYADRLDVELKSRGVAHCRVASGRLTPSAVKALVGRADAALSGRMHVAIACLGSCTPPACLSYLGKFDGLFKHFGLENMVLEPLEAIDPDVLYAHITSVLDRSEDLREQIRAGLDPVTKLSLLNLEHPGRRG